MSKKKEEDGKKKKNLLEKYNESDAKGNVKFSSMKTGADFVIGVPLGCGIGAVLGIWAPLAGLVLFGAGHYLGDKSGMLRILGASATAYGIAKAAQNRSAVREASTDGVTLGSLGSGIKSRLIAFKDDLSQAFFVDKITGKKSEPAPEGLGSVDLSELDVYDNLTRETAITHETKKLAPQPVQSFGEVVIKSPEIEPIEGINYAPFEREYDLSTI